MSDSVINQMYSFDRIKLSDQTYQQQQDRIVFEASPDRRYTPICHACGGSDYRLHTRDSRSLQDVPMASAQVEIDCTFRKIYCRQCDQIRNEDLKFFDTYDRITNRMKRYIYTLCDEMSINAVADHLDLSWRTVRDVEKEFLKDEYSGIDMDGVKLLGVDEISIRKPRKYMTVVVDYDTGRVLWMGEGRDSDSLAGFFEQIEEEQREQIEAVAMDMHDPYIKAVRENLDQADVVFDLFHVVKAYNEVIDKVRNQQKREASLEELQVISGSKYLLLKNDENLKKKSVTS